jgi:hypothetical protein
MTRYLVSFPSGAMDHIREEEMPAVGEAAHAVVKEAMDAGVWVFGGGLAEDVDPVMVAGDGTITAGTYITDQRLQRRVHRPRRALAGGSFAVGREDRGRLPLCSRDPGVHARPGRGQLIGPVGCASDLYAGTFRALVGHTAPGAPTSPTPTKLRINSEDLERERRDSNPRPPA